MSAAIGSFGASQYMILNAISYNQRMYQQSLERLSTGIRINRADDDPSGLILRDRYHSQAMGLEEAIRNIQSAGGMLQVAEEGINKITETLQQMRQLAVRAADDNLNDGDRSDVQVHIKALLREINDRVSRTKYNGRTLLDGSISESVEAQRASAQVQSNATLRNGAKLFDIGLADGANATTFGAVCQGSYEVKLVYRSSSATGSVDAVIYWSDGGNPPAIVSTLTDVTAGAKAFEGKGIILTVNTVSRYDVGVAGYAKTLTYVSATYEDNALQFQVGADEGEVERVGIRALDVRSLFRGDYGPDGISVETTLQAQDLIGQIDDALRIAGRTNLHVGSFKNSMDRTLDFTRSSHTQIRSAYSLINDADMAMESTNLARRNILIQAGYAMLAQANSMNSIVLQLLK